MIRPGAAFCLIVGIAACGGAPFSAIGSLDAGELADAGGLDEVLVDVHQVDAGADVPGEVLDAHQVDEQIDEVLVDVHQVDAGADAVDEVLVDAGCLHTDGMGQSFTACEGAPGSYDRTLAEDACAAYAAATPGAACVAVQLGCPGSGFGVCAEGSSSCTCWEYAGPGAGHVHAGAACACATSSDPSWE